MRLFTLALILLFALPIHSAMAHCQVPCGIFDDKREFSALEEDIRTIEKAMTEINRLSEEGNDVHTIARWTANKEKHAQKIQNSAAEYFLAQRVKVPSPDAPDNVFNDYVKSTTLLHQVIVAAMKCKQTVDLESAMKLRTTLSQYKSHYFKDHGHE